MAHLPPPPRARPCCQCVALLQCVPFVNQVAPGTWRSSQSCAVLLPFHGAGPSSTALHSCAPPVTWQKAQRSSVRDQSIGSRLLLQHRSPCCSDVDVQLATWTCMAARSCPCPCAPSIVREHCPQVVTILVPSCVHAHDLPGRAAQRELAQPPVCESPPMMWCLHACCAECRQCSGATWQPVRSCVRMRFCGSVTCPCLRQRHPSMHKRMLKIHRQARENSAGALPTMVQARLHASHAPKAACTLPRPLKRAAAPLLMPQFSAVILHACAPLVCVARDY
jgi:hypothetical protein